MLSEYGTLQRAIDLLQECRTPKAREAAALLIALQKQVASGIHVNPSLLLFGNGRAQVFSKDVLALVYIHADDGKHYCHGFGDADIRLSTTGSALTIGGLKQKTGVQMAAMPDGSVRLVKPGHALTEDFD